MIYGQTRIEKEKNLKLVKLYFDMRRTFDSGFQPYYFFRRRIEFIIGMPNRKVVRSIFNHLRNTNIIQKVIIYGSCYYLYNPANLPHEVIFAKNKLKREISFT